jgi:hypothetical protein
VRARRRFLATLVLGTLIFALTLLGCATTSSTPKTVTDIKQLVGSWNGWIEERGGARFQYRATLSIREDGTWAIVTERNPTYYGRMGIADGVVRWAAADPKLPWYGTATLVEENGREWLTLRRPTGEVWTEVARGK